jgi:hypothetical protein
MELPKLSSVVRDVKSSQASHLHDVLARRAGVFGSG